MPGCHYGPRRNPTKSTTMHHCLQFAETLINDLHLPSILTTDDFNAWSVQYFRHYDTTALRDDGFGEVTSSTTIHWEREDWFKGCSKLYSPGTLQDNELMYNYNQLTKSGGLGLPTGSEILDNHIYFCGDMYSFCSGWVEGALRTASDAILWMLHKHSVIDATSPEFSYPIIDVELGPNLPEST